jgi:hypothetical protein
MTIVELLGCQYCTESLSSADVINLINNYVKANPSTPYLVQLNEALLELGSVNVPLIASIAASVAEQEAVTSINEVVAGVNQIMASANAVTQGLIATYAVQVAAQSSAASSQIAAVSSQSTAQLTAINTTKIVLNQNL